MSTSTYPAPPEDTIQPNWDSETVKEISLVTQELTAYSVSIEDSFGLLNEQLTQIRSEEGTSQELRDFINGYLAPIENYRRVCTCNNPL